MGKCTLKSSKQFLPDPVGHVMRLRGIHIMTQDQRPQQQLPVFTYESQLAIPIEAAVGSIDHMGNVSAIEAFPFVHEELRSDQLFRSEHARSHAADHGRTRS